MTTRALSSGVFADRLMRGPTTTAIGLGHGHLRVGRYVVSLTPPGSSRMPNGIECPLVLGRGQEAVIGDGALRADNARVLTGPVWDSRPTVGVLLEASPLQHFDVDALIGAGPGLTPQGDDVLIGFVAGRVLFHDDVMTARRILLASTGKTTALSETLLLHAARGELPEQAHDLLATGVADRLLSFGHSSGKAILLGLALACRRSPRSSTRPAEEIPLDGAEGIPSTVVRIYPVAGASNVVVSPTLRQPRSMAGRP